MKFKLTAEEVEKIINDITLNGNTNEAVVVSVSLPDDNTRCMDIVVGKSIYMGDLLEIAKHFDDTNILLDVFDGELVLIIGPGEQFFEEGGEK